MNITDNEGIRFLMELVGMPSWPSIQARYNISPTQALDVLTLSGGQLQHGSMDWGIIPVWAKEGQFKRPLINARAETIWEKPSFKNLVKSQRMLVPVSGFYEWMREQDSKTPFYIHPAKGKAMLLGGIYQVNNEGKSQCSLITTAANESMTRVHHRMPVIIQADNAASWLQEPDPAIVSALMQPAANDVLAMHEVSSYVNSSRNQGEECSKAVG